MLTSETQDPRNFREVAVSVTVGGSRIPVFARIFAVFGTLLGMLLIRNRFLFSTPLYELGDTGANSIIVGQAKHFELLVGNYSRQGFNHPGPGYFYVEAFGEWLFYDLLGLVPTPWNGQLLALYVLNAAMFATVVMILGRKGLWALVAIIALISLQPQIINNAWMPYVYVPSFLLFLVASTSVATGRKEHLWAAALAGGFLVHGHAAFLLFVPAVGGTAAFLLIRKHGFQLRAWLPAFGIIAVFLLPMLLNTVLNWPGEFGKYLTYGSSDTAGGRSLPRAIGYVYWYWWPFKSMPVALAGIAVIAGVVYAASRSKEPFVRAGLWLSAIVTGLLLFYAYAGIDHLGDPYMGFFYWSVPLLFAIFLTLSTPLSAPDFVPLALVVLVMAAVPGFRTITNDHDPTVPATLSALRDAAGGRPVVVEITDNDIGPEVPGLTRWARREGLRMCVRDKHWRFITSPEFICSDAEAASGFVVSRIKVMPEVPKLPGEIARSGRSAFVV